MNVPEKFDYRRCATCGAMRPKNALIYQADVCDGKIVVETLKYHCEDQALCARLKEGPTNAAPATPP